MCIGAWKLRLRKIIPYLLRYVWLDMETMLVRPTRLVSDNGRTQTHCVTRVAAEKPFFLARHHNHANFVRPAVKYFSSSFRAKREKKSPKSSKKSFSAWNRQTRIAWDANGWQCVFVPSFIMTVDYCFHGKWDRMGLCVAMCVPRISWFNPLILINVFRRCRCCHWCHRRRLLL